MARPLRIERPGGRYHVTARGNERTHIFKNDTDRFHFLKLLAEQTERFGTRIHAYVLMDNHFHLMLETPESNLSRSMQWLGVSYSIWFNRRYDRAGHLFRGRFKGIIVEDDAGWQELARYVHLNPVRVISLGLGKRDRAASREGMVARPEPAVIAERLRVLREYRWSSYRGYAGYCVALNWICDEPLSRLCGGRGDAETKGRSARIHRAGGPSGNHRATLGPVGSRDGAGQRGICANTSAGLRANRREQPQLKALARPVEWSRIISALEEAKGESCEGSHPGHTRVTPSLLTDGSRLGFTRR